MAETPVERQARITANVLVGIVVAAPVAILVAAVGQALGWWGPSGPMWGAG